MMKKFSFRFYYILFSLLLLVSLVMSVRLGAVEISWMEISNFLFHPDHAGGSIKQELFYYIRLPRVLLCTLVGASLSVSGALMQALFRNPIVEPGLAGTSSGAAFGAAFVFVMGKSLTGDFVTFISPFMLPFFAFAGALIATLAVYKLSNVFGKTNVNTMILAGIAMNALANGGTGFFSYVARDPQARSITFWNLGTVSGADWQGVAMVSVSTIAGILLALKYSKSLNALMLGEEEAG